jgi:hypothetical protein
MKIGKCKMNSSEATWSKTEKRIARKAFDLAYSREMKEIKKTLQKMITESTEDKDIWKIAEYLQEKRKGMDMRYDYRYSVLFTTFLLLMKYGYLKESDLEGLSPDKISRIRSSAEFFIKGR